MSKYKFVAKMFSGLEKVAEIGCQEGFGAPLIQQEVSQYYGIDFYRPFIEFCIKANTSKSSSFEVHDICSSRLNNQFDGIFALDVLEHISPESTGRFFENICLSLTAHGAVIIGMPSIESQRYAGEPSRIGHVNCMNKETLRQVSSKYFQNVFMFSMNDEVVHTGFDPMSNYILALCCSPIPSK